MTDELKLGISEGDGCLTTESKGDNRSSDETKMDSNLPNGYLGDQNDFSESMLLGQFPDNFDVSDACGWMTHDDFTDFQQQKRFEGNDGQQMGYNGNDNRFNSNYRVNSNPIGQQGPQMNIQGQGMLQSSGQQNNHQSTSQASLIHQQLPPLLHTQLAQPSKVQEIILSSSQYNQQLHEMHLHHLEQISHTTNSSEYYNRPLEGPRSVLPIDSMNHETGAWLQMTRRTFLLSSVAKYSISVSNSTYMNTKCITCRKICYQWDNHRLMRSLMYHTTCPHWN